MQAELALGDEDRVRARARRDAIRGRLAEQVGQPLSDKDPLWAVMIIMQEAEKDIDASVEAIVKRAAAEIALTTADHREQSKLVANEFVRKAGEWIEEVVRFSMDQGADAATARLSAVLDDFDRRWRERVAAEAVAGTRLRRTAILMAIGAAVTLVASGVAVGAAIVGLVVR